MKAVGRPALAWRRTAAILGLSAAFVGAFDRRVLFDLEPAAYEESVRLFTPSVATVEIDPRRPDARIPYVLPGPSDSWAGSVAHALELRLGGGLRRNVVLDLHAVETHEASPPTLTVSVDGTTVRTVQTRPGYGLAPPHGARGMRSRYSVPIPAATVGGGTRLSIANASGSWIMWERLRLVEADRTFALANLTRRPPLAPLGAVLLVASLGGLAVAGFQGADGGARRRALLGAGAPALALSLFGLATVLPQVAPPGGFPRWLWLGMPGLLLMIRTPVTQWSVVALAIGAGVGLVKSPFLALTAEIAGPLAVLGTVLLHIGFGVTWMLRSWRLAPVLPLFTPVVGLATLAVFGYALGHAPWGTDRTAWPLLGLFALLNGLAWRRGARPGLGRTQVLGLAGGGLALLLAVVPIYQVGYLTTMGGTIDALSYLTRAEHLRASGLLREPPYTVATPIAEAVAGLVNMGFRGGDVIVLSFLCSLLDMRPHRLFPILMAAGYALIPIGMFVVAAYSLRHGRVAALIAGMLVAVQPLLHWAIMDDFLSQVMGAAVWPFAVVAGLTALSAGGWRRVGLAGLLLGALSAFYQLYLTYAVGLVGLFALFEWRRRSGTGRLQAFAKLAARAVGIGVVAWLIVPASWVGTVRTFRLLGAEISRAQVTPRMLGNILVFPHPGEVVGLVNHVEAAYHVGLPQMPARLATALLVVGGAVGLYAFRRCAKQPRWIMAAILVTFGAAIWHQRFWLAMGRGFAYGYFKAVSLASPLAIVLLAGGLVLAYRDAGRLPSPVRALSRLGLLGLLGGLFGVALFHLLTSSAFVNRTWLQADRAMLELEQAVRVVPAGEPLLVIDERHPGRTWLLYVLGHPAMYGRQPNPGYSAAPAARSDRLIRYALIAEPERPRDALPGEPWLDPGLREVIWRNPRYALVRRTDDVVADLPVGLGVPPPRLDTPLQIDLRDGLIQVGPVETPGSWLRQRLAGPADRLELVVSGSPGSGLVLEQAGSRRAMVLGSGPQPLELPARQPMSVRIEQQPGAPVALLAVRARAESK